MYQAYVYIKIINKIIKIILEKYFNIYSHNILHYTIKSWLYRFILMAWPSVKNALKVPSIDDNDKSSEITENVSRTSITFHK